MHANRIVFSDLSLYLSKERSTGGFIHVSRGREESKSMVWRLPLPVSLWLTADAFSQSCQRGRFAGEEEEGGRWGWVYADSSVTSKQTHQSWEWKWRTSAGSPEGDVTAPEWLISGGNGGVEGHPGVMLVWLQHVYIKDFQKMTPHG